MHRSLSNDNLDSDKIKMNQPLSAHLSIRTSSLGSDKKSQMIESYVDQKSLNEETHEFRSSDQNYTDSQSVQFKVDGSLDQELEQV